MCLESKQKIHSALHHKSERKKEIITSFDIKHLFWAENFVHHGIMEH